ncbi:MAG: 30S ribosomal protein S6 [Armatimonadetes bacterium]|nr:30S ribosomal protein S6 [Armatimonadota bacterium]
MGNYEGLFLVNIAYASKDWERVASHVRTILEKNGAEILHFEKWQERRLAYEIGRHRKGVYVLIYFKAEPQAISEIRRESNLSETILRCMILAHSSKRFEKLLEEAKLVEVEQQLPQQPQEEESAELKEELVISETDDISPPEDEAGEVGISEQAEVVAVEAEVSPQPEDEVSEESVSEQESPQEEIPQAFEQPAPDSQLTQTDEPVTDDKENSE